MNWRGRWRGRWDGTIGIAIVCALAAAITLLRQPGVLIAPQLWAEDGAVWLAEAYNEGALTAVFRPHTGYVQLFSRLVAAAVSGLPLAWAPHLFMLASLGAHVLPVAILMSRRLEPAIGSANVRLTLVGVYLLLPYPGETYLNVTNAHWRLVFAAFLLVVASPPRSRLARASDMGIHLLTGLSGLHVAFLWVCAIVNAMIERRRWSRVVAGLYTAALAIQTMAMFASSSAGARDLGPIEPSASVFVRIIGGQVALGALGGSRGVVWAHASPYGALASLLGFAILFAVLVNALWRGPNALRLYILLGVLIVAGGLATPMVEPGADQWALLQIPPAGSRYWLHLRMAMIVAVVWGSVSRGRTRIVGESVAGSRRVRMPSGEAMSSMAHRIVLAIILVAALVDFRLPPMPDPGFREYAERFDALPSGEELSIPVNPPGWEMRLIRR